jgi:hypothetical protein
MSDFGGGADVQQIRVIAVVMITVLLGSARMRHSQKQKTPLMQRFLYFLNRPTSDLHRGPAKGNCAAKKVIQIASGCTLMCNRRTRVKRCYCAVAGAAGAAGA